MRFRLKNLRLGEEGLSKVLGFLEAEVMDAVWDGGETTVRSVRDALGKKKTYSFNTIMTVMNRLVEKKLLAKRQLDGSFSYRAAVGREEFSREVTKSVVSALVSDGSLFQVAAFVEAMKECSEEDLRELKRVIDAAG